jgi:hypothetical protein
MNREKDSIATLRLKTAATDTYTPAGVGWLILRVGLVAGTLDITENIIFNLFRHITPKMIFQYIASGLIGIDAAIALGMASVLLGVAIHYFIALSWTALYYAASRKLRVLIRRPAISGILYGGFVYVVMNFVVLPLTRVPPRRAAMTIPSRVSGVLALLFCIGLTVALLFARADQAGRAPVRN